MKSHARTPGRVLITAAALVAATVLPQVAAGAAQAPGRAASAVPHYQHIAVILMTDHGYSNIIGKRHAPTINALAKQYGLRRQLRQAGHSGDHVRAAVAAWQQRDHADLHRG
jgi:hypothetical protein